MFGNHTGRRMKNHSGRKHCGSGLGRGQRGRCKAGNGTPYQNNSYGMDTMNWNRELENRFDDNSLTGTESLDKIEGVCPLCKNHCPLSAPKCIKGQTYVSALKSGEKKLEI
jgi:hypothetical protein